MKRYALIVGIDEYKTEARLPNYVSPTRLHKAKRDAKAVYDLLYAHGDFYDIDFLTDADATCDELKAALKRVLLERGEQAEVLIYFAGHGFTARPSEFERQGYLATYDCQLTGVEMTLTDVKDGLSFEFLNGVIGAAQKGGLSGLAVLLDCCESEFFIEQTLIASKLNSLEKQSCFLSAACRSFENARENERHGVYTGALVAALTDREAITKTGEMTVSEAHNRVERALKLSGQEAISFGYGSSMVMVRYGAQPVEPIVSEECPYQGLRAFTPETAEFFFGRDEETQELMRKLQGTNFVPVLGPSGSGKSSVVRAGLVTRLLTEGWQVVTMKPDKQPMVELERSLRMFLEEQGFSQGSVREMLVGLGYLLRKHSVNDYAQPPVVADFRVLSDTEAKSNNRVASDNRALSVVEGRLAQADIKLLLVVDQFEEVFTLCENKAMQRAFVEQLLLSEIDASSRVKVVMTMRSDFVDDWLAAGLSRSPIGKDTVWLGALQGENLAAAIERPAQKQGYAFEAGLLTLLLNDVDKEENCLPLLEFALTALWDKRDTQARKMTVKAYEAMGGLEGALDRQATAVYENLREVDKVWAKRICLQLVRVGRGDKDTRQRQPKEMLLNIGGAGQRQVVADVVADLVKGRLLVSDGDVTVGTEGEIDQTTESASYVDIAHEALLEGWEQFVQWRQDDRDLLRLEQRMTDAYEEWKDKEALGEEERDKYLLTGGLLAEVREQKSVLSDRLSDSQPVLIKYFADSDQKDKANVATLKTALAKADVQEASRKVRDKLLFTPVQTVDATISAIDLVHQSQQDFAGDVIYPVQDALHRAWFKIRERLKLAGHSSSVHSVAFSPNGDRIVSGSADNTLRLWDLSGNAIGSPFEGHSDSVRSVAFSPNGNRIVSGSTDNTLRLWDLSGNAIGSPFEGHSSSVRSVAFSPDGNRIVSGSTDKTLRLWDLSGNAVGSPFEGHSDSVHSVAFSPDGNRIVSGSDDNALRLWDLSGNAVGSPFEGHSNWVRSVAFSPNGDCIVSGSDDSTLRLWDLSGNAVGSSFKGHGSSVTSVAFSSDGDRIVSSSTDNTLRLWDLLGNAIGSPFEGHSGSVYSVAFSPNGDCIVSGSHDNTLRLWDLSSNAIGSPFEGHSGLVTSVAFSPNGDRIVSGSYDNTLRLWDLSSNAIGSPLKGHSGLVLSVAFSPNGDRIVSGSYDNTLRLWDLSGNAIGSPFEGHSGLVTSVAFSPDGDHIVSGSHDNTLRLWDLSGNAIGLPFEGHSGLVASVAFSPNGDRIVSGSTDGTLRLWDLSGNAVGLPFEGHSGLVYSVAFSPDGDRIVSGSFDHTLRLWDLSGNAVGSPFEGHSSSVHSVAFSPDGDRIVSGSFDHTLRLWDLSGNAIGSPFEGHSSLVRSVAFSPDGDRIVSGSNDSTLRLWCVGTWEDELRYCCNTLRHHTALTLPQTEMAQKACEVCQQVWTRQQSAEFLVAQGNALARQGEVGEAIAKFTRAKELDPAITIDPAARANELADWSRSR